MFCLATEICRRTRLQAGSDNLKDITDRLKLRVQPTTTKKEREMLMKIAECKSQKDIDKLLAIFYTQQNMDPMCRYIRLAFATAAELWSSRLLLRIDHNEPWFRTHAYLAVFDNAFIYDDKFTSKRADYYICFLCRILTLYNGKNLIFITNKIKVMTFLIHIITNNMSIVLP